MPLAGRGTRTQPQPRPDERDVAHRLQWMGPVAHAPRMVDGHVTLDC